MKPISILIVDDHPLVRLGLARSIEYNRDMIVCGEASSVSEALLKIESCNPDMLIVDLSLEDSDGLDLLEELKKRPQRIPVLVVSMYDDPFYIEKAFQAGAKGYLLKRESVQKVGTAIRQIWDGRIYASEDISMRMLSSMVEKHFSPTALNIRQILSNREFEIFEQIGQGKKRQEIAATLNISDRTVDTHMSRIKEKLKIESNTKLAHCAIKFFMKSL